MEEFIVKRWRSYTQREVVPEPTSEKHEKMKIYRSTLTFGNSLRNVPKRFLMENNGKYVEGWKFPRCHVTSQGWRVSM